MAVADNQYRLRRRTLLAKAETTAGVDASPVVGSNAVRIENMQMRPEFDVIQTAEVTDSLDNSAPIVGGGRVRLTASINAKGAGTAGSAPEAGMLLRGCAMLESGAAATSGTAQAGASTTLTLASNASSVDDFFKGRPIAITAGSGNGETNIVAAYNGTTKVATVSRPWTETPNSASAYSLPIGVMYRSVSTALENLTLYHYENPIQTTGSSRLTKVIGAAGTCKITVETRKVGKLEFDFVGQLAAAPTNVAPPAAPTYQSVQPEPFLAAEAYLGGVAVKFNMVSFDLAAKAEMPDDPAATFGYDIAGHVDRRIAVMIRPRLTLLSTRDSFTDFINGTPRDLWIRWGDSAGKRISVFAPGVVYTGATPSDENGFVAEELAAEAPNGLFYFVH